MTFSLPYQTLNHSQVSTNERIGLEVLPGKVEWHILLIFFGVFLSLQSSTQPSLKMEPAVRCSLRKPENASTLTHTHIHRPALPNCDCGVKIDFSQLLSFTCFPHPAFNSNYFGKSFPSNWQHLACGTGKVKPAQCSRPSYSSDRVSEASSSKKPEPTTVF